jgi:hypothetical protein
MLAGINRDASLSSSVPLTPHVADETVTPHYIYVYYSIATPHYYYYNIG